MKDAEKSEVDLTEVDKLFNINIGTQSKDEEE